MKLKDVTDAYLEDIYDCDVDVIFKDYIKLIMYLRARLSQCTLSYADQMQLKADIDNMEI